MTLNKKEKSRVRTLAAKSGMTYQAALQQAVGRQPRQSLTLTAVSLANFRGFRELDLELSPFTVVLGHNAYGKSTLLAALHLAAMSLDLAARDATLGTSIDVSSAFAGETEISRDFWMKAELGGSTARRAVFTASNIGERPRVNLQLSAAVSSTRVKRTVVTPKLSTLSTLMIRHLGAEEGSQRDVLRNWLAGLSADGINAVNRNLVDLADARLLPSPQRDSHDKARKIYFERGGVRRELSEANSSLIALLRLLAGLETCSAAEGQPLILLDEPEAHLHPTLQVEMASRVATWREEKAARAVMVTHSREVAARLQALPGTSVLEFPAPLISPRRVHILGEGAGKFAFEKKVDSGGFAEVYAATDLVLRRRVAIKLFRPGGTDISTAVDHAQALGRISHQNVVRIYEVTKLLHPVDRDERSAIVMEYLDGPTLAKILSGPPLERVQWVELCMGIIAGLKALHDGGIVHSDLHDENIQLDASGVPKILDVLYRGTLARLPVVERKRRIQQDVAVVAALLGQILIHSMQADVALSFRRLAAGASSMDEIARAFEQVVRFVADDQPSVR